MDFKDYYKTLGVGRNASEADIRKAFRKLAREHHPDVAKNKAQAEEKFKEINEAYEVLGDPKKRRQYDELGANWDASGGSPPPPGWQRSGRFRTPQDRANQFEFKFGDTGFSEFFERFFGRRGYSSSGAEDWDESDFSGDTMSQRSSQAGSGHAVESDILVTLNEVLKGTLRNVSIQSRDPNTGRSTSRKLRVRIPAGVKEGQLIRVASRGESGGESGGDLYLRVRLARHPDFRVQGVDLFHDLDATPWEAVLGTEIAVPTLEGEITVRIPPGTCQGQKLRLRGQGLPADKGTRGDLFVVVQIQVPKQLNAEEKQLWEKLARISGFHPRRAS
jgi:curved DNA-binding protein